MNKLNPEKIWLRVKERLFDWFSQQPIKQSHQIEGFLPIGFHLRETIDADVKALWFSYQYTDPKLLSDAFNVVWMLDTKHLGVEKSICVNGWMRHVV